MCGVVRANVRVKNALAALWRQCILTVIVDKSCTLIDIVRIFDDLSGSVSNENESSIIVHLNVVLGTVIAMTVLLGASLLAYV